MDNENIKEILDYLKIENGTYGSELSYEETHILLDYITNLQEENDILKRDIEAIKHNYKLLVRLIENGESMTQKFENGLTYQDYKSRNKKAIEYIMTELITEWDIKNDGYVSGSDLPVDAIIPLLNILQGEDEK